MKTDTSMGGSRSSFPRTSVWDVLHSGNGWKERSREHLDWLARAYWKPIYCYIRRAFSRSDADAKDTTQAFWIHIQEKDLLGRFDRRKGNFRSYLKRCLRSFIGTEVKMATRLKRGGDRASVSLDEEIAESIAAPKDESDRIFDREWASQVFQRASLDLKTALCSEGKQLYFEVFRACVMESERIRPSYQVVARKFGLKATDVGNYLRAARQVFRSKVIEAVREYLVDPDELTGELEVILGPDK